MKKTLIILVLSVLAIGCASKEKKSGDNDEKETYVRAYNPQVHQR